MEEEIDLDSVILGFVDDQIMKNDPPKTRKTFERLISMGFSEEVAKNLIASVLTSELFEILNTDETFDFERYAQALDSLP
jgi:hypothetical protein